MDASDSEEAGDMLGWERRKQTEDALHGRRGTETGMLGVTRGRWPIFF
jgi:hypothetical protein